MQYSLTSLMIQRDIQLKPKAAATALEMSRSSSSSSSGEEDGDAEWKAAIESISSSSVPFSSSSNTPAVAATGGPRNPNAVDIQTSQNHFKHYQLKAQKILNDVIEKTIEVVSDTSSFPCEDLAENGGGIQLFKNAPLGIVFDYFEEVQGPTKKPRLLPGEGIDEKSTKFKKQLQSVVVDGRDILAAARDAGQHSLAKQETREAAARAASKREEERVAELKKIRGERWLPCMAKDGHVKSQRG